MDLCQVKCFEPEIAETFPLKHAGDVADILRSMLAGSNQAIIKKNNNIIPAITEVPAAHGMVKIDIDVLLAPVKASVGSAALPSHKSGSHGHYFSPTLSKALLSFAGSILHCASMSEQRFEKLVLTLKGTEFLQDAMKLNGIVDGLHHTSVSSYEKIAELTRNLAYAKTSKDLPSVACANIAYSVLKDFSKLISCELLASILCIEFRRSCEPEVQEGKKKGKGKGGFVLGQGSIAFMELVQSMLSGSKESLEEDLQALKINGSDGASNPLKDIDVAFENLFMQLDPCNQGIKNVVTSINSVLESNAATRKPKIAKGARDFGPEQMAIREVAFQKITNVFKKHGAVSIDTPVFELRETLMGKYGEDSKLIYDLADQGGEILSLRYDLTVPFARHVAVHGITNIKRYHIAKVYRRDQPQMNRGRFREFFQCDFDIAGTYAPMVPDAEVLKVLVEILDDLDLGDYEIKINHRKLLDAMLDIAGVPSQKFRPICSAIDKLDKEPWEAVKHEMVVEKGLAEEVADCIGEFVVLRGEPKALLAKLSEASHPLSQHAMSSEALREMAILFDFLDVMGALKPFSFDLSLARGLDYYTGVIYEAVFKGGSVGSIAAGGRYDTLVGMFSGKEVPAVGVSIGIERVFAILEAKMKEQASSRGGTIRETETQVLVASIGSDLQKDRMKIASELWNAGIKTEFGFKPNPKMGDQLNYALKTGIPLLVLFGEDEINSGVVKLKDLDAGTEAIVARDSIVTEIKKKMESLDDRRIVYRDA